MRRDIIRKDIRIDNFDYEFLCSLINKYKNLFISKGAEKGDSVCVIIPGCSIHHIASYMACLELGLPLFIYSDNLWNISEKHFIDGEDNNYVPYMENLMAQFRYYQKINNKNRHFIQFTLAERHEQHEQYLYAGVMMDILEDVSTYIDYNTVENMSDEYNQPWEVYDYDVALLMTDDIRFDIEITYEELKDNLDFQTGDVFGFSMGLHHYGVLQNGILPALKNSKKIISLLMPSPSLYGEKSKVLFPRTINKMKSHNITTMYTNNRDSMKTLFETMGDDDFRETVRIIITEERGEFHDYWEAEKNIIFEKNA